MRENLSLGFSNKKGADHAHPHSLISAWLFEITICYNEILIIELISVAEQAGLNFTSLETPKTGFVASRPIIDGMYVQ